MPEGVVPTLGPDATGVGHVFRYTVESNTHSLRELRTIQDWYLRYQLNAVPGVAEVAGVGGHVKQYQIDIDPNRLRGYGIPLGEVIEAVRNSNQNVGGDVLEARQNQALLQFPEVAQVVAKVGRADTSTDPSPLNMTETIVRLKPRSEWRPGMTVERLRADMDEAVRVPGVANIWTMPIINHRDHPWLEEEGR